MLNKDLMALLQRPALDAGHMAALYHALWDDEHISKGMLESHLSPNEQGATCRHDFVFESVQWIAQIAPPSQFNKLLDLGCGPGIYAEAFAKKGYAVTGLDYAKRSIAYAKGQTDLHHSGIVYYYQNYLEIDYHSAFDIITIINKDYPVLMHPDRVALLKKIYQALKPGGRFVFDVLTPKMRQSESQSWQYCAHGGFYSPKPYLLLEAIYEYDDEDITELGQHIVITEDGAYCYLTPNHFFAKEQLMSELQPIGFDSINFYGDVAGNAYRDAGETICVVAQK